MIWEYDVILGVQCMNFLRPSAEGAYVGRYQMVLEMVHGFRTSSCPTVTIVMGQPWAKPQSEITYISYMLKIYIYNIYIYIHIRYMLHIYIYIIINIYIYMIISSSSNKSPLAMAKRAQGPLRFCSSTGTSMMRSVRDLCFNMITWA